MERLLSYSKVGDLLMLKAQKNFLKVLGEICYSVIEQVDNPRDYQLWLHIDIISGAVF